MGWGCRGHRGQALSLAPCPRRALGWRRDGAEHPEPWPVLGAMEVLQVGEGGNYFDFLDCLLMGFDN